MNTKPDNNNGISKWALFVSIVSMFVSGIFSIRQCYFENTLHKLNIDPVMEYFLVRSGESDSLEFYVKNTSPIPAVNLSIIHKYYVFYKKNKKYRIAKFGSTSILDTPGQWIFRQKISPNETINKEEFEIIRKLNLNKNISEIIITAIFEITYYRETDMKQYNNKAIFFLDGKKIYSYKNALKQESLSDPIEQLPMFEQNEKDFNADILLEKDGNSLFQKAE